MTNETKITLHQLSSMLRTGELHGGSITQRAKFVVAIGEAIVEGIADQPEKKERLDGVSELIEKKSS